MKSQSSVISSSSLLQAGENHCPGVLGFTRPFTALDETSTAQSENQYQEIRLLNGNIIGMAKPI